MPRGKFVVFEGIDGCGKGTQISRANNYVFNLSKDYDLLLTREPTRDFAEIRSRMASGSDVKKDAYWYLNAFVSDRRNHCLNYISPNLERGTHVFCDRFKYSTLAYQQTQGISLAEIIAEHEKYKEILVPDLTIIYDCQANVAFERRKKAGAIDVFDKDFSFQEKLREKYLLLQRELSQERIVVIDGSMDVDEVFNETKKYLDQLFKK